jgi:hypothetical protein
MIKPTIFIGSSSEGLTVARAISKCLQPSAKATVWDEGVFGVSDTYIESIITALDTFDFAVLIFRADDEQISRGISAPATRGNVLFELGLFMGHHRRDRTFVVYDSSAKPEVISDLKGLSFASYKGRRQGGLTQAVKPACKTIVQALRKFRQHYSKPADVKRRLRAVSEWVWDLASQKLIFDWNFDLHFHAPNVKTTNSSLDIPGFSVYEVKKCNYNLRLPANPLCLGITFGEIETGSAWKRNLAYLHQVYLDELSTSEKEAISETIHNYLSDPHLAWDAFFENVQIRMKEIDKDRAYTLQPLAPETGHSYVMREFRLPREAKRLIDKEVQLQISFRSLTPTSLCHFTVEFPWLTFRCDAQVVIHGKNQYVIKSNHSWGDSLPSVNMEDYGNMSKVRIRSDDLVMPRSSVDIRWSRAKGDVTMNHVGGGGKKAAGKRGTKKAAKKTAAKKGKAKKAAKKAAKKR